MLAFWEAARDPNRPYQNEVMSAGLRQAEGRSRPKATIVAEINDLASRGLLGVIPDGESVASEDATIAGLEAFGTFGGRVDLTAAGLTNMGRTLCLNSLPWLALARPLSAHERSLMGHPVVAAGAHERDLLRIWRMPGPTPSRMPESRWTFLARV